MAEAHPAPEETAKNPFELVPVEITVSIGHARPRIGELMKMAPDSILSLDRRVDDPVELYIGDKLIARGELEELEGDSAGQLAVRLTEIAGRLSDL
ncbi:MAG: FliM/FliN family flagellar motor switch protein [Deltaproteobacteria bacterium]|nr:MAG: FliM/FliN family flagellar motor switch protein [Deltaproteobacteria bacterium]